MPARVVVLNGASSVGKSSLARALQRRLEPGWFLLGVDDLLAALQPAGDDPRLLEVSSTGVVHTTDALRRAEKAWYADVAALAQQAVGVLLDEVLLDGAASQERLAAALVGCTPFWVGVVCDLEVALQRERLRADRVVGMHAEQRDRVHAGVRYDHVVDASTGSPDEFAQELHAVLRSRGFCSAG